MPLQSRRHGLGGVYGGCLKRDGRTGLDTEVRASKRRGYQNLTGHAS
jgi:hypothetical protein